jgi:hypothetical protein
MMHHIMGSESLNLWLCFFSEVTSKHAGHLLIEDSQSSTEKQFLEEGFLDFLRKVYRKT